MIRMKLTRKQKEELIDELLAERFWRGYIQVLLDGYNDED